MKYLAIHTPVEDMGVEAFVSVLEVDDELRKDVSFRMDILKSFPSDAEVCSVSFRCNGSLYDGTIGNDAGWKIVDDLLSLGDNARLDGMQMVFSEFGMWISVTPKHWNEAVESAFIRNEDLEGMLKL